MSEEEKHYDEGEDTLLPPEPRGVRLRDSMKPGVRESQTMNTESLQKFAELHIREVVQKQMFDNYNIDPDEWLEPISDYVYKAVSKQIREIFLEYTNLVEPLSLDEAYLDVSDCQTCEGSATLIAREIRQRVRDEYWPDRAA